MQPKCGNIMYSGKSSAPDEFSPEAAAAVTPNGDAADSSPGVSLIDFEYSGYNPRGFDVGNHFCEWMADYSTAEPHMLDLERYPSPQERRLFCAEYLGATKAVSGIGDTGPWWIIAAKVVPDLMAVGKLHLHVAVAAARYISPFSRENFESTEELKCPAGPCSSRRMERTARGGFG